MRVIFANPPDVPLTKFTLAIAGAKKGLFSVAGGPLPGLPSRHRLFRRAKRGDPGSARRDQGGLQEGRQGRKADAGEGGIVKRALVLAVTLAWLTFGASAAQAQEEKPTVVGSWPTGVGAEVVNLRAEINSGGLATTYLFEYTTEADFRTKGFIGATKKPQPGSRSAKASSPSASTN